MQSKQFFDFINKHNHMVVSTLSSDGKPQSAVVGFAINDRLQLIFGTSKASRKAHNIAQNSAISVVIGWDNDGTVQLEGTARLLQKEKLDKLAEFYFAKNPWARALVNDPERQHYLIDPSWLRYTDITTHPWTVNELRLENASR